MTTKVLGFFFILALARIYLGAIKSAEYRMSADIWEGYPAVRHGPLDIISMNVPLKKLVVVTIYHPVEEQCDDSPDILASGLKIQIDRASEYRYCAVSRDLLVRWGGNFRYGDIIVIQGAEDLDGLWIIQDTMNPRWTNRVDLLRTPGSPDRYYEDVVMHRV